MPHSTPTSRWLARAFSVLVAGVLLAACGTAHPSATATGVPAQSIALPLQVAACATTHCFVAGASLSGTGPTTEAERETTAGQWVSVSTPALTSGSLQSASCNDSTCLVGGISGQSDLLWKYSPVTSSFTAATPVTLHPGTGVVATACAPTTCFYVDRTMGNIYQLVSLASPAVAHDIPVSASDQLTTLSCPTASTCWVGLSGKLGVLEKTVNGGLAWTATPTSATSITGLFCTTATCVMLAHGASSVSTTSSTTTTAATTGATGTTTPAPTNVSTAVPVAAALGCLTATQCAVVGATTATPAGGAATWWTPSGTRVVSLTYVPTGLTAVGCGTTQCVAVGPTTIVTLRP